MNKQIQCPECNQIAYASPEDNGDYRCVCGNRIPKGIGDQLDQLASDGDLAGVSISFWGGLIQKLRDKHGCIIWVSPVSDEKTDKVIGWYYEGEWLLEKGILPNTFYNNTWHQSANAAEKAAVEWACKEIGIEVSALVDDERNGYTSSNVLDQVQKAQKLVKESDSLPCVINRFMCQVLRDGEVIETRISQDESDIDNWIFTFKEIYSKYGKQIKYQKGVLIDC